MNESYVEVMVKKQTSIVKKLLFWVIKFFCVFSSVLFFLTINAYMLIGAFLLGLAWYFVRLNVDLEYEYLYVDKEITIDKIMAKTKRKRITKIGMDRLEIIAPVGSHHLDNYKDRLSKTPDYSSGKADAKRYMIIYDGLKSVILEPGEDMLHMIKNIAPRKVFND